MKKDYLKPNAEFIKLTAHESMMNVGVGNGTLVSEPLEDEWM